MVGPGTPVFHRELIGDDGEKARGRVVECPSREVNCYCLTIFDHVHVHWNNLPYGVTFDPLRELILRRNRTW